MFEQTFKNIDDIIHKDAGCGSELDYVEQNSRALFLKYLDDLERDRATSAELTGKTNPLNENDLAEFVALQKTFADSENSWTVNVKDFDQSTSDLSVKNPNKKKKPPYENRKPFWKK